MKNTPCIRNNLKEPAERMRGGFNWLRKETSGGLFCCEIKKKIAKLRGVNG
jgi:hypothetical protein